ncbi:NfeD family protein [Nocardioides sp.]|uniref:NfeD family protein n=1 Tax=Nocardioides sp. TaxID=35761 RepID=UPI00260413C4|nr:NfeD family protein [Nocardioides sp.]MDI6908282.1 NfeD family protein [Nocardioides sp.]
MDWLGEHAWAAWLGVAAVLGMAELVSLDLVLIMLAVGAMAGMVTAAIGAAVVVQVLVAGGAAVAMLALVRPSLVARLHRGPELRLGTSKLVGQRAVVTETITGLSVGRIRLAGETWSAAPYDEHVTIEPGATVEVFEIRGATAYVHPVSELGE